ncbi:MAG: hypothetical protein DLD55_02425 [candidate division SR1 bacterium]|nr:MAG: hypothetical protein DLD55_02425 [candidate division SR1 bacterium]
MKNRLQIGFGVLFGILLGTGIALFFPTEEVQAPSGENKHTFNAESRKKLIPEDCQTFFDGCNTCYKTPGEEEAGCTEMFCATYQAPKCLDEEVKSPEYLPSCEGDEEMIQCSLPPMPLELQRISREEAKKLILEGKVKSLFQAHSLQVNLTTEEGSFTTQEPKIDEVWKVWKACGSPCAQMQLATE